MVHQKPMIEEYVGQALMTDFKLVESKGEEFKGITSQRIALKIDEDAVETSAFGIMYVIGLLSFLQGRPAGLSEMDYNGQDIWSVEDFCRRVSFVRGTLRFHADYVRGRLMKTSVEITRDGTVVIETINRADQASQWAEYLLGKRGLLEFIREDALGTVQ